MKVLVWNNVLALSTRGNYLPSAAINKYSTVHSSNSEGVSGRIDLTR